MSSIICDARVDVGQRLREPNVDEFSCPCRRASRSMRFDPALRRGTMLQLYGNPRSRAMRCLWMLEEMGQPYQLIEKSTRADDLRTAEYIRLNPNARIPTLVDGDVTL